MLQQVLNKTKVMLTPTKKQTHVYKTGNPKMAREENSIGLHLYTFALFQNFLFENFFTSVHQTLQNCLLRINLIWALF